MKKLLTSIVGILCVCATFTAFASCGKTEGGKMTTYTMEAEYTDLTGVVGGGNSTEANGCRMIYGNGTQEEKDKGWSAGYFIGYTHKEGMQLTFKFNAEEAATGVTIVLRLGSEMGNLTFDPTSFSVKLNDQEIDYHSISLSNSPTLGEMRFFDKTVSTTSSLKKGENVIKLTVLSNGLAGGTTAGPIIDCVKVTTKSKVTFTEHKDNITKRDNNVDEEIL